MPCLFSNMSNALHFASPTTINRLIINLANIKFVLYIKRYRVFEGKAMYDLLFIKKRDIRSIFTWEFGDN